MLGASAIVKKVHHLRAKARHRDQRMTEILAIREGRWDDVYPGLFPPEFPKPMVANMIDVAARDTSEVIAPLPSFDCSSAKMTSDRARVFADKRTKIAKYYVDCSNLQVQMYPGADRLGSYGFVAFHVEPDLQEKMPKIRIDDTFQAYYQNDPWNRYTVYYCRTFKRDLDELIAEFPDAAARLQAHRPEYDQDRKCDIDVVRWFDADQQCLVTLEKGIMLQRVENPLSHCPVRVVEMPKLGQQVRGQYDDVIWVQMARALAQVYALQAMDESVNAPIATPNDVQEFSLGPKEILRSETPQNIGRVNLQIPNGVFAELQNLTQELRVGSRYPEGRSGQIDASIITGQGVEALMGTFSTQTQTAQLMLARGLRDVMEMCFEMDEKLWPNVRKTIKGNDAGSPYEVAYVPSRDIRGDYSCEVTYGLSGGLDPNRAAVLILQLQAARLISNDTAMRQLPVDISVEDEKQRIAVEESRMALNQAVAAYSQAIPMLASQGGDPAMPVQQIAEYIRLLQKGESVEEAAGAVFAPPPPPEPSPAEAGGMPAEAGPPGAPAPALPGAPAQQGGAQDLLMSLAGMTAGGAPNLQATVSKRTPI